jgi:hypothetical protein
MGRTLVLGFAAVLVLCGCGGGDGDDPLAVTIDLLSDPARDGFVLNDGTANTAGSGPGVGDIDFLVNGRAGREFFHFDLTPIPPGATIVSAVLVANQANVVGTPYATHGVVLVDHVDFGAALDGGDFGAAALTAGLATLSSDATAGSKAAGVTSAVVADRAAARTTTQFRLRFSLLDTDVDGAADVALFTDGERSDSSPPGTEPTLRVTYNP